jgi:hypothetical protein
MIRFIYVCMIVVAVSVVSIAGQFVMGDIQEAQQALAERNSEGPLNEAVAAAQPSEDMSAEALNQIDTAAGDVTVDGAENNTFGVPFTGQTPAALADAPEPQEGTPAASDQSGN